MNRILRFSCILVLAIILSVSVASILPSCSTIIAGNDEYIVATNDNSTVAALANKKVYLGGYAVGITLDGKGVTVVALNEFTNIDNQLCCPAVQSGITIGDTILSIDDISINSSATLSNIALKSQGRQLTVKYLHAGKESTTTITPQMDKVNRHYRLGLWTRDSSSGIGTVTFFQQDLRFASLGHPICDSKGNIVATNNGGVYYCDINGINKGMKGSAGELKGTFDVNNRIGEISINSKYGVYGNFSRIPQFDTQLIEVANISEVKPGYAQIYTTLDDNTRVCYDIEIVKAVNQKVKDDKGMVIRITDEKLLSKTGGIVQGMSGSPIVQNNKLVGAVTHVFVNDPTRGYGMFAQWMLDN